MTYLHDSMEKFRRGHRHSWLILYSITIPATESSELEAIDFSPIIAAIGVGEKVEGWSLYNVRGIGESHGLIVAASPLKSCRFRKLFI